MCAVAIIVFDSTMRFYFLFDYLDELYYRLFIVSSLRSLSFGHVVISGLLDHIVVVGQKI